jgi:transcriptional regulator with XRE-family HTH domain
VKHEDAHEDADAQEAAQKGQERLLRVTDAERLDAIGIEGIAQRIESGQTQRQIAADLDMPVSTLNAWLRKDEHSARARAAMQQSAEAWLDRGMSALEEAPPDQAEIARARALEQHCARRAAIRNPAYRDGANVDHTVAVKITKIETVIVDPINAQG